LASSTTGSSPHARAYHCPASWSAMIDELVAPPLLS